MRVKLFLVSAAIVVSALYAAGYYDDRYNSSTPSDSERHWEPGIYFNIQYCKITAYQIIPEDTNASYFGFRV